jgi:hypothetical protein
MSDAVLAQSTSGFANTALEILGNEVLIQQVRFIAASSTAAPGTFDL